MNPSDLERDLKEIVGERVTANPFELQFYTKEIVHIPEAVRAMLKTAPVAIVKPGFLPGFLLPTDSIHPRSLCAPHYR